MSRRQWTSLLFISALLLAACRIRGGSEARPPTTATPPPTPTVSIPNAVPAPEIELPPGFLAFEVAEGFESPTTVTVSPDGDVYVSQLNGPVFRLEDGDGDGIFDRHVTYTTALADAKIDGLAFSPEGDLYVSSAGTVSVVRDRDGDTVADAREDVITGLPAWQHQNNGLAFGPDGKLYLTNGSTCNECIEPDERSGTILQAAPDGSDLRVYARGVRNAYDLVFDGQGRLWAPDNGSDPPCNTVDELNLIEDGSDYGWPYEPACDSEQSGIQPVAHLGFNNAPAGIGYYDAAQFPAAYRGTLFVALWGTLWGEHPEPRLPPRGHTLVNISVDESAGTVRGTVEEFATGFKTPIDVTVDGDGTLLVLDYGGGTLYRIVYKGT